MCASGEVGTQVRYRVAHFSILRSEPTFVVEPYSPLVFFLLLFSIVHQQNGASSSSSSSSAPTNAVVVVPLLSWYGTDLFRPSSNSSGSSQGNSSVHGHSAGMTGSTCGSSGNASDGQTVREELTWGLSQLEEHFDAQCRWPPPLGLAGDPTFSLAPNIAPFMASLNDQVGRLWCTSHHFDTSNLTTFCFAVE